MKSKNARRIPSILMIFALLLSMFTPVIGSVQAEGTSNTVADAIANNEGIATVEGYIVGTAISGTNYNQEAPFLSATNLGLADSPEETDPAKILPVQLPSGEIRTGLNLKDNPENFQKKVSITGSLEAYFAVPGLKSLTAFEFVQDVTYATDLIISEYIEGSSSNKAIELYNGTGTEVDLSNYTVELYANGNETVNSTAELTGTLADGEVYVIFHGQAADEIKAVGDLQNNVVNFNGDDAIVLKNNEEIIDSVGQIPDRVNNLKDVTLVRNSNIISGDTDPYDAFDPSIEWTSYPNNTFNYLGSHVMDGSAPVEPGNPGEPEPETPVEPITIADARNAVGQDVTVEAIVTTGTGFWGGQGYYIQDNSAGIYVYQSSTNVKAGDKVKITGPVSEYSGELQIQPKSVEVISNNNVLPVVQTVTPTGINADTQGELVKLENVTITDLKEYSYGTFEFVAVAENGEKVVVRHDNRTGSDYSDFVTHYNEGEAVHVIGVASVYNGTFQLKPLGLDSYDLVNKPAVYASVLPGHVAKDTQVELNSGWENANIYYTTDGSEPTVDSENYAEAVILTENVQIKAIAVTAEETSEVFIFEYNVIDYEDIRIHDIQGASHVSPMKGEFVTDVEGIVTYIYKLNGGNYFHFQTPDNMTDEDPKTSEGLVVYTGNQAAPVEIGDLVSVTGTVDEFHIDGYYNTKAETDLSVTQINARDDRGGVVKVVKNDVPLPEPIKITSENLPSEEISSTAFEVFDPEEYAIDFWESMEGMLVTFDTLKAVAPQEHGDLITVLEDRETDTVNGGVLLTEEQTNPDRIHFKLYDNNAARNFEVATGDKFEGPITGVVNYGFQNYKVYADLEYMEAKHVKGEAKPEVTTIEHAEDKLTIAAYNLENFSNNKSSTSDDKAKKLARAIGTDMGSPDIVGVTEVQDNNGATDSGDSSANQSYERLITAIKAESGVEYKYLNIDPINNQDGGAPGANIRVGFLYNPERVSLPEGISAGDATTAVTYQDGKLSHNPGRIDPNNEAFRSSRKPLAAQFDFQGEEVVVIVNHWNSKSGDTPLFGSTQPATLGSEVQRIKIANVVNNFVEEIKTDNPDANIVSVGDFNDFQWSSALKIHEGEHMTNMINHVEENDRYTYLYQGNSQVLDHILVSNNLKESTEIDILHINADFTDMAGRASDHDPVMVQIDLAAATNDGEGEQEAPTPITPEKTYNFKDFKTNKLTVTKPSVSVSLDGDSKIENGVLFTGEYAEFHGAGFADTTITIKPKAKDAIIDLKGTSVQQIIIDYSDGGSVKEIRGIDVEKINMDVDFKYENGANSDGIKFTNEKGEPIGSPFLLPEEIKSIPNQSVQAGETITLSLNDYFQDPNEGTLTYASTLGTITDDTLTLNLETGIHLVAVTVSNDVGNITARFSVEVEAVEGERDYYADARGKEGIELKQALHEIIDDHHELTYSEVWDALKITDEDPNNPNNVILLYSGISRSKDKNGGMVGDWNREHTWAKSHGGFGTSKGPGTDIHHLRPTDVQVNSTRGNLDFDYVNGTFNVKNCLECKRGADAWEPPNEVKGDVARMLFYMAVRYESGDKVDLELNDKVNNGSTPYHGKLSTLLEWHEQDPVDEWERNRNDKIQDIQGNRNPFIDEPEWAFNIWDAS